MLSIQNSFEDLKKRNKILFTLIVSIAIIIFWKGVWGLTDVVFDSILFQEHLFWSNLAAAILGIAILLAAGMVLEKLV